MEDHIACMNDIEAAKWLAKSVHTLRKWRMTGQGPAYIKIGGNIRYRIEDLQEYVSKNRIIPQNAMSKKDA